MQQSTRQGLAIFLAVTAAAVAFGGDDEFSGDQIAYVRYRNGGENVSMSGSSRDARYARRVAEKLGAKELLYIRDDERHYVVTDRAASTRR